MLCGLLPLAAVCVEPEPPPTTPPVPVELARIEVGDNVPVPRVEDIDQDGQDDLIIADLFAGSYPYTESGEVRVLSGPIASGNWKDLPALLVLRGEAPFRHFGSTLASSDLDDDGTADLVLRADTSADGVGKACVVSGALRGEHTIESSAFLTITGPATLGQAMVGLDYNEDGFQDLIVSAPVRSEVYVILGPRSGSLQLPDDADAVFYTENGSLGWTVTSGDFDGDGKPDLALSEPSGDAVFVVSTGALGRHRVEDLALATIRSHEERDDLTGSELLTSTTGPAAGLFIRSRRTDLEQAGAIFILEGPLIGDLDARRDARLVLEYSAAVLGTTGTWVCPSPTGPWLLAVGTPGQSQIPQSDLKGALWLLSEDLHGTVVLNSQALGEQAWCLRAHEVDMDWLTRDLLTGSLIERDRQNLVLSGQGGVVVLGWP